MSVLRYIVRRAEPEVMGSGSIYFNETVARTEEEAFQLLSEGGRNEIVRVSRVNGEPRYAYWDAACKVWEK